MSSRPLVSVFLPTYNHESFIAQAITSALQQDYENLRVIIGDDCSTDGTWTIVSDFANDYPGKITAFRNDTNLGVTANFNEVLMRCKGDYIAFLAGDDVFLPGKIRSQVALMESDPDCCLCYHDVEVFESDSAAAIRSWNSGGRHSRPVSGDSMRVAHELVVHGTAFMAAIGVMVRRAAVPPWGFDPRIPVASDWLMWIDVCARSCGTVRYDGAVLSKYRRHSSNITSRATYDDTDQLVTLAIVEARYPSLRPAVRQARGYFYYRSGVERVLEGEYVNGRQDLYSGVRYSVYSFKWLGWWLFSIVRQVWSYFGRV